MAYITQIGRTTAFIDIDHMTVAEFELHTGLGHLGSFARTFVVTKMHVGQTP